MADHLVGGLHCADLADLAAGFVLGALEPAESEAVRQHLAGCPEAHPEFAELGGVVPALFEAVDVVQPPAALRERILAAAAAEAPRADEAPSAIEPQPAAGPVPALEPLPLPALEPPRPVEVPRPGAMRRILGRPIWAAVAIAAALVVVALGAWNLSLRSQIDGLTAYRDGVATVLDAAARPGARLAVLAGAGGAGGPSGLASIAGGGTGVSMVMRDLVPTTGTEVYEAWLIAGDNVPVPIGSFTVSASGVATFSTTAPGPTDLPSLTLALTREPGPGATTPTKPIVALGTAS